MFGIVSDINCLHTIIFTLDTVYHSFYKNRIFSKKIVTFVVVDSSANIKLAISLNYVFSRCKSLSDIGLRASDIFFLYFGWLFTAL